MLEVIASLKETIEFCKVNWSLFGESLPGYQNTFRSIWNALALTVELLECYKKQWSSRPLHGRTPGEIHRIQSQNWDRVNQISKWAFVSAVSSIEYSSKLLIKRASSGPLKLLGESKRVYLSEIINHSKKNSMVDDDTHAQWSALLELRNVSVHNAAFAEDTGNHKVGDVIVRFKKGEMLQGNLLFYANMIKSLVQYFKGWLEVFLDTHD